MPRQHRQHAFDIREKKKIVDEALSTPKKVRATARKCDVQPKQIRDWKKSTLESEGSFKGNPKKKKTFHGGTTSKHDSVLNKLYDFYVAHRAKNLPVTMSLLIAKFKQRHREGFGVEDEPTRDAITVLSRPMTPCYRSHFSLDHA